jgi:alpha-1,3-glucosyltransferase
VHRHWLALTNTLPISQWYFDETSQWTLDYPPFFAYFSWLLGIPAKIWDPKIVDLKGGLEYDGWKCVMYMRLSVIVTELVLASALFALSRQSFTTHNVAKIPSVVAAALLLHPGLLIVDHIHFQYNGFLYGILLWSIWAAREVRHES